MNITYKYSDYLTRALRGYHHNSLRFWLSNSLGLAVILLEIVAYAFTSNASLLWIALFVLVILGLSYVTAAFWQPAKLSTDPTYRKTFAISVGEDDIRLSSEDVNSEASWDLVKSVWETKAFYYIFLGKKQFWIVPRDRFDNAEEEERFRRIVGKHREIRSGLIR
ncbi:YcxB family protein [Cohnella suwonensis]|uniref:YcxB family protein n=1 Tax=Cohnella suwonensis TaxID=696072 RepID=A0ABW0LY94_9BACL